MTKKDYLRAAALVAGEQKPNRREVMTDAFVTFFSENPRFNEAGFRQACKTDAELLVDFADGRF
jgi:hypothetical protein